MASLPGRIASRWRHLYRIAANPALPPKRRFFAGSELFCLPFSLLALALLPVVTLLRLLTDWTPPDGLINGVMPVAAMAGIGYLTNYLAIKMLFEPYYQREFHLLKLLTGGLWRQGVLPANRANIGHKLAVEIPRRLLKPEQLSLQLSQALDDVLADPELLAQIRGSIERFLSQRRERLIASLLPQLAESLTEVLNRQLSDDGIRKFWANVIDRWLRNENNREMIARQIVAAIQRKSPQMTELVRETVEDGLRHYANRLSLGLTGNLAAKISYFVNWDRVETSIRAKLGEPATVELVKSELHTVSEQFKNQLLDQRSGYYLEELKSHIADFLSSYLTAELPKMIRQLLNSEELWEYLRAEVLPLAQRYIRRWLRREGREVVLQRLNFGKQIEYAVARQDIRDFQRMVDTLAANQLGAIHLLGFLLGLLFGLLMVLPNFCGQL